MLDNYLDKQNDYLARKSEIINQPAYKVINFLLIKYIIIIFCLNYIYKKIGNLKVEGETE